MDVTLDQVIEKLKKVKACGRVLLMARTRSITDDKDVWNLSSEVTWAGRPATEAKEMTLEQIKEVLSKPADRHPEYRLVVKAITKTGGERVAGERVTGSKKKTDDRDVWNLSGPIDIKLIDKPSTQD